MLPFRETVASIVLLLACASCREGRHSEEAEGYRDRFSVDPGSLKSEGTSTFFPLVPGTVRVYRDEDETVTITVLAETRVVDGVTTRVIEEREEEDGKLKEVSRNFFAICAKTNDVFYFGEEVDEYEDCEIVSHGGAWLAGEDGAQPGIIMPGTFLLGARYFQEIACDVAMDRGENTAMGLTIETPYGVLEDCVEVIETSPLEPGSESRKVYAPGIGLVIDSDAELVDVIEHVGGDDEDEGCEPGGDEDGSND